MDKLFANKKTSMLAGWTLNLVDGMNIAASPRPIESLWLWLGLITLFLRINIVKIVP